MRRQAERDRLREAQRAATHIPAAGDARAVITCRVSLLDGTDVSVDLPVQFADLHVRAEVICFSGAAGRGGGSGHLGRWDPHLPHRCMDQVAFDSWSAGTSLELVAFNWNFQMLGQLLV